MYPTQATAPKPRAHQIKTAAAPIGGLNTRDSLANMPPGDCPTLINWVPDIGGVRSRGGYFEWAINFPGNATVQSIIPYFSSTTTFPGGSFVDTPSVLPGKVFGVTDNGFYDITSTTNAPVLSQALSGVSQAGWVHSTMLTNSAGAFMLVCSEVDGYKYYDGAAWTTPPAGVGVGQINGVDPALLAFVTLWKKRAWFVEKNSTRAWYLPTASITGIVAQVDFGPLFKRGGSLAFLANWTMDAGEGIDDFLVGVSSNGDVVIYKGSDPSSATTFALVGQWYIGQIPIGRRNFTQLGGDLVIMSTEGVFPISQITRGGTELLAAKGDYSSKVRPSIGAYARKTFTSYGWQLAVHATERLMVLNTPDSTDVTSSQYAMSTTLTAWTIFSGIPALCLGVTAGYMLAGTVGGKVYLILNGAGDNAPYGSTIGSAIHATIQFSFNYFEAPALEKQFLMARATFITSVKPGHVLDVDTNFTRTALRPATPNPAVISSTVWDGVVTDPYALFDTGYWDGIPGERGVYWADWRSVSGLGYAGAATMNTALTTRTVLTAMDYMYQVGGPL